MSLKPKFGLKNSAIAVVQPMMLLMLSLWLVGQVALLWAEPFSSWDLGYYMGFYPGNYALRHQPWGIITYTWWHNDLLSLGLNSLSLYGLARLYDERQGQGPRFLLTFVWGSLWGAIFYALVAYLSAMLGLIQIFPLYGASAGVCALAFRLAMCAPRRKLRFMGLQLNFLLLLLVLYALITLLSGENIGGILAHLGGALYGIVIALNEAKHTKPREAKRDKEGSTTQGLSLQAEQEALSRRLRESGYKSLSPEEQEKL